MATSNGWVNADQLDDHAFCGRNLGQIESKPVSQGAYFPRKISRYLTSVQEITTPSALVPSIGEPSEEYGPMGIGPTKGRRPLVLVSKPYTSDPDGWKQVSLLPSAVETVVRAAFRKDYSHVDRCKEEQIKKETGSIRLPHSNFLRSTAQIRIPIWFRPSWTGRLRLCQ